MELRSGIIKAAAATAITAALSLAAAPAGAAPPQAISGQVARDGYTVIAVAQDGRTARARPSPGFRIRPPASRVTLHLIDPQGIYAGPVVVGRRGRRAVVGVRAGARLGPLRVVPGEGYAEVRRRLARRSQDRRLVARARGGVPVGAASFGRVRSAATGTAGPGRDQDLDGVPAIFDVDDDGDLVPDVSERRKRGASRPAALPAQGAEQIGDEGAGLLALATPGLVAVCPGLACEGAVRVEVRDLAQEDLALGAAMLALALALASLALQLWLALRGRRRRVSVDAHLGMPVYQQGGGDWAVFIEVHNRTTHPVRWTSAALETRDGRSLYLMQHPAGGELPAVVEPHDSHHTWARASELERSGLDLHGRLRAVVKLDSGEVLRSRRRRLLSRSRH